MRKIILFPFSVLYAFGTSVRNFLFDRKLNRSIEFDLPVIGVGNLAVGGQGKTPMVEYLIELSKEFFKTGVLSRGYGRKTKGFLKVELTTVTSDCGDEPLQVKQKFPEAMVCVCEDRATGIPLMLGEDELDLILMDDAFQHRWVKPGLNILLSDFNAPFFNDFPLPAGNLRESRNGYRRADIIVFTRCLDFPDEIVRKNYLKKIPAIDKSKVFFAGLEYGEPYSFFLNPKISFPISTIKKAVLVSGIAHPNYLIQYLKEKNIEFEELIFPDHHEFTESDFQKIKSAYRKIHDEQGIIITTEKDAVRLKKIYGDIIFYKSVTLALPIKMKFHPEEKIRFDKIIFDFVRTKLHYNN